MERSIRKQMIISFMGLIVFMVLICGTMNVLFLEKYYTSNKKEDLLEMYMQLEVTIETNQMNSESNRITLQKYIEKSNISFLVINEYSEVIVGTNQDQDWLQLQLLSYQLDKNPNKLELLADNDGYEITRALDPRNQLEYIEMWGYLPSGEAFIIRSPMDSIIASANIATSFLIYISSIVILVSGLFVWYFSKRVTAPILELADISKSMANLQFDIKYNNHTYQEINILGESFNVMAATLEETISELKRVNNELIIDIKNKEESESMRTEFLANVSHELKTPIALIQGYAEGLVENIHDDVDSKQFYCEVIMDEAEKMNQLVKNLLELNHLEFGLGSDCVERFDIVEMTKGILQSVDIIVKQKEVEVKLDSDKKVYVWGDQFKIEHVIRNYVTNALNHVKDENIIDIKILIISDKVRISVFNTGDKIPNYDIDKIWDKFYKVDKARTREYGGNGIGLSVVKAIMSSLNQPYGVKNYSNGVEFWFELDNK